MSNISGYSSERSAPCVEETCLTASCGTLDSDFSDLPRMSIRIPPQCVNKLGVFLVGQFEVFASISTLKPAAFSEYHTILSPLDASLTDDKSSNILEMIFCKLFACLHINQQPAERLQRTTNLCRLIKLRTDEFPFVGFVFLDRFE